MDIRILDNEVIRFKEGACYFAYEKHGDYFFRECERVVYETRVTKDLCEIIFWCLGGNIRKRIGTI